MRLANMLRKFVDVLDSDDEEPVTRPRLALPPPNEPPVAEAPTIRPRLALAPAEQPEAALQRPRVVTAAPTEAAGRPALPAPAAAPAETPLSALSPSVEPLSRPRWSSPVAQETEHNMALSAAMEHPEKARGLKRFLPVLRGFAVGGPGGALYGLGESLLDPTAGTRMSLQNQYARSSQRLGTLQAQRQAGLEEAGKVAGINKTYAETQRILNPPAKDIAPHYETRADGTYVVDAQNPEGRKLSGVPGKPSEGRQPKTEWIGGVLHVYDERGIPRPVKDDDGNLVKDDTRAPVQVTLGGQTFTVSPGAGLQAVATAEGSRITAENEGGRQNAREQNENNRVGFENDNRAWGEVQKATNEYNTKRDAFDAAYSAGLAAERGSDEATKAYWRGEVLRLKTELDAAGQGIDNTYAYMGADGRYHMNPSARPKRPNVVPTPAPRSRNVTLSRPSAKPLTAEAVKGMTEAEVRSEARRLGKDEEAAVAKWRRLRQ